MAFRKILEYPSTNLLKKSTASNDPDLAHQIVTDLIDTLNVVGGVGLSAPQIGFRKRIIYIKTPEFEGEMINPVFTSGEETVSLPEACLSLPGIYENIERYSSINVQYENVEGEQQQVVLDGFPAQVVQHEVDHLDGKLMLNYMSRMKKSSAHRKMRKLQKKAAKYIADSSAEKEITKIKKNSHLSRKEIKIRRRRRKQNR